MKSVYGLLVIGLLGAIAIGVMTHASGFSTAFGSVANFYTTVQKNLT
jgi:hypothetical protein